MIVDHHQQLDQGEPRARAAGAAAPCSNRLLIVPVRSSAMTCNPAWFLVLVGWVQPTRSQRRLRWVPPTPQKCANHYSSLPLWKLVMLSRSRIRRPRSPTLIYALLGFVVVDGSDSAGDVG